MVRSVACFAWIDTIIRSILAHILTIRIASDYRPFSRGISFVLAYPFVSARLRDSYCSVDVPTSMYCRLRYADPFRIVSVAYSFERCVACVDIDAGLHDVVCFRARFVACLCAFVLYIVLRSDERAIPPTPMNSPHTPTLTMPLEPPRIVFYTFASLCFIPRIIMFYTSHRIAFYTSRQYRFIHSLVMQLLTQHIKLRRKSHKVMTSSLPYTSYVVAVKRATE